MKRVAGNTLALFASHFSALVFALVQAKVIAIWLGPSGFGIYASGVAAGAVFGIVVELGLPFVLLRFIPLFEARGERDKSRDLVRFAILVSSSAALIIIVLLTLFGGVVASLFDEPALGPRIIVFGAGYIAAGVLRAIIYSAFNGLSRMTYPLFFEILFQAIVTAWILIARRTLDVTGLFTINIVSGVFVCGISAVTLWRVFFRGGSARKLTIPGSAREISGFWKGAAVMTLTGLGLENSDRLVVGAFMPFQAVSILHVASRIMYFFRKLLFLPLLAVSPEITRKWDKGGAEIGPDLRLLMKLEFMLGILVLCFVILGKKALVLAITTNQFASSESYLLFMAVLVPPACLYASITTALRATGRIALSVGSDLAWYFLYLVSGIMLIGRFGLWGMMAAQAFASVSVLFLNMRLAKVYLGFSFSEISPRHLLLSVAPALLASIGLARLFDPSGIPALLGLMLPVVLFFNLGIALGGILGASERGRIQELLSGRKLAAVAVFLLEWPGRVFAKS